MSSGNTVFATSATVGVGYNWTFIVNDAGQVIFTNSEYTDYTIAQHMGNSQPYSNLAPGIYKDGAVYPTLYKLAEEIVVPEVPTLSDSVEMNGDVIVGGELVFNDVEDGVSIWYKLEYNSTEDAIAHEENTEGYTRYEGPVTLTSAMSGVSFYAEKDGVKSDVKYYAIDIESGIVGIAAESGEVVYYNMQGVRVENPVNGLFIRVANGKSQKVVL